jgi:hypothetical protein
MWSSMREVPRSIRGLPRSFFSLPLIFWASPFPWRLCLRIDLASSLRVRKYLPITLIFGCQSLSSRGLCVRLGWLGQLAAGAGLARMVVVVSTAKLD